MAATSPSDKLPEWTRPKLYGKQRRAIFNSSRFAIIEASTKSGKSQPLDAMVYTPAGPKRMGEVVAGDVVLDPHGGITEVVGVYPQGVLDVYEVTFSDGAAVRCSLDHLWEVWSYMRAPQVMALKQLLDSDGWRGTWIRNASRGVYLRQGLEPPDDHRFFHAVRGVGRAPCQCIEVAADDGLYLTDGLVVTHNTVGCLAWLLELWAGVKLSEAQLATAPAWYRPGRNRLYRWVAPYYPQAKIAYNRVRNTVNEALYTWNKSDLTIENRGNGNILEFRSGEKPDALYGDDVHAAVVDEASRCRPEAWHAVRSTLTATGGPCRIIGNVKGKKNWSYRLARRAQDGELPGWRYYRITAYDAIQGGVLSADEIAEAKATLPPEVFDELYRAIPTDDGANPFGMQFINANTFDPDVIVDRKAVAWGWDLGRKRDWTVGIGLNAKGHVVEMVRFRENWTHAMEKIYAATGQLPAVVDATGLGDPVVNQLEEKMRRVRGFIFSAKSKQRTLEALALAIQQHRITWEEQHTVLISELKDFEYSHTRNGITYSAPEGLHDDCVMALALAREALTDPKLRPLLVW